LSIGNHPEEQNQNEHLDLQDDLDYHFDQVADRIKNLHVVEQFKPQQEEHHCLLLRRYHIKELSFDCIDGNQRETAEINQVLDTFEVVEALDSHLQAFVKDEHGVKK